MTEEEAKTKMCCGPQVVATAVALAGPNQVQLIDRPGRCIASECMAWRWTSEIERRWGGDAPDGEGWQRVEAIGGIAHWARTHKTPHGYCGLAGAPRWDETADPIDEAERAVGRFIYDRIEHLMDATAGTPAGDELTYLAQIATDVEEYDAKAAEWDAPSLPQRPL